MASPATLDYPRLERLAASLNHRAPRAVAALLETPPYPRGAGTRRAGREGVSLR